MKLLLLLSLTLQGQAVPPSLCFPIESLPAEDRAPAEALFLQLMDSEALYTVIGGVKPMSSGFVSLRLPASSLESAPADAVRRQLEAFRCGDGVFATLHHFARLFPDRDSKVVERFFEGAVIHRAGLRRQIEAHKSFFVPLGLGIFSHPLEVLMAIEFAEAPTRFRGLGHLYGYPDYAVDFFVSAGRQQALSGIFVARDFVSMPTFARAERGVVYAIEKGSQEREIDHQFRARLAAILADYQKRRATYIGEGKPGIIALLRDWFCQSGSCAVP